MNPEFHSGLFTLKPFRAFYPFQKSVGNGQSFERSNSLKHKVDKCTDKIIR
jgi:hypothetical protein